MSGVVGLRGAVAYDAFVSISTVASAQVEAAVEHLLEVMGGRGTNLEPSTSSGKYRTSLQRATWPRRCGGIWTGRGTSSCSPPAGSRVADIGDEVRRWLARRGVDWPLLVLVAGDLVWDRLKTRFDRDRSTPLPQEFVSARPAEPKWADLRWTREGSFDPEDDRFFNAVADLSATIMEVPNTSWPSRRPSACG